MFETTEWTIPTRVEALRLAVESTGNNSSASHNDTNSILDRANRFKNYLEEDDDED